jgi:hypothetical protein
MSFNSFSFFGDVITTENLSSLAVKDKFELIKPDFRILTSIKSHIKLYGQHNNIGHNLYETDVIKDYSNKKGKLISTTFKKLPRENWKYFIFAHNHKVDNRIIPLMLALSEIDLTVLMQGNIVENAHEIQGYYNLVSGLSASMFYHDLPNIDLPIKNLNDKDFLEFEGLFDKLTEFEKLKYDFPKIDKALDDFLSIQHISKFSPFKILSYITIFELLLSDYDPRNQSNTRISDQLKQKISTINSKSENPVVVSKYLHGPDTLNVENVICKLYTYRSNIAHGKEHDFQNDLQIFKGKRDEIIAFLRDLLKNVLLYSLVEPEEVTSMGS